jgi:hypothetical protein
MKYSVPNSPSSLPAAGVYYVNSGDEVTYIAWKLEEGVLPYGLRWRDICGLIGMVDPMQVAAPLGQDERFLLGERIRIGQPLEILQ